MEKLLTIIFIFIVVWAILSVFGWALSVVLNPALVQMGLNKITTTDGIGIIAGIYVIIGFLKFFGTI